MQSTQKLTLHIFNFCKRSYSQAKQHPQVVHFTRLQKQGGGWSFKCFIVKNSPHAHLIVIAKYQIGQNDLAVLTDFKTQLSSGITTHPNCQHAIVM